MATFIETNELTGGVIPQTAGGIIRKEQYGIDATLSGFIIQDVNISEERITDTTQDQKGAVVSQLDYDTHWSMSMTVIGGDGTETGGPAGLKPGDIDFEWAGKKWKITSVTYAGSYQDKKKYTISAERWTNFPAQN